MSPSVGTPNQLDLIALRKGDMAIEPHGPSEEVLIALGRLAAARLK